MSLGGALTASGMVIAGFLPHEAASCRCTPHSWKTSTGHLGLPAMGLAVMPAVAWQSHQPRARQAGQPKLVTANTDSCSCYQSLKLGIVCPVATDTGNRSQEVRALISNLPIIHCGILENYTVAQLLAPLCTKPWTLLARVTQIHNCHTLPLQPSKTPA